MKKNDWFVLVSGSAYSYLFFEQNAGLNFLIFSVLLTLLFVIRNTGLITKPSWITISIGTVFSGFAVFYYGTPFAFCANIFSLLLLAALSFNPSSSLFISFFNSCYSILLSVPVMIIRLWGSAKTEDPKWDLKVKRFILLIFPVFITVVFFLLYRASNPLFESITNQINLDFISINWLLFTLFGFILMYGFFYHQMVKAFTEADQRNSNTLGFVSDEQHKGSFVAAFVSLSNELFTGIVLFALLNILLLAANGTDIYYLYFLHHLPESLTLSEYLHDGTEALIFSIILAISIILFYFRGRLNFSESNKMPRLLAYIWIAQNIFMIVTTLNRNYIYVSNFGLTHKRIGVYVFLGLCVFGLVTAFVKVMYVRSGWFLFRKNTWSWYIVLVTASLFNWDAIIAKYNLKLAKKQMTIPDAFYLGGLNHTSLSALYEFYGLEQKHNSESKIFSPYLLAEMDRKYKVLSYDVANSEWQSSCLIKIQTKKKIDELMKIKQLSPE